MSIINCVRPEGCFRPACLKEGRCRMEPAHPRFTDVSAAFPCGHTDAEHDQGFGGQSCAVMAISAPQNNARPPTLTTPWQRMGLVTLVNFQTEEAIEEVFTRLDIEPMYRSIWRTPSGTLRGSGVLWNRRKAP